jgi:hypothetical protein
VLAVAVAGFVLLFSLRRRTRSRSTMGPSGATDAYRDEPEKGPSVVLPPVA